MHFPEVTAKSAPPPIDVLCTFKINIKSQNVELVCIKD